MKKSSLFIIAALVLAVALPTFAGEKHKKCDASAEECLKHMKEKPVLMGYVKEGKRRVVLV